MPATLEPPTAPAVSPVPAPAAPTSADSPPINPMADALTKMQDYFGKNPEETPRSRGPSQRRSSPKSAEPPKEETPKEDDAKAETQSETTAAADEDELGDELDAKAKAETKTDDSVKPKTEAESKSTDSSKKISPWKLVDQYKSKVSELERQIAEIRTKPPEDPEKQTLAQRLSEHEKRLKEYEEEMRYVNYQKHPEFLDKYQKPWEDAFAKAGSELKGLKVTYEQDGEAKARDLTLQDIAHMAAMDPAEARSLIKEKFPEDAEEVKYHIKEIRRLAEARTKALEDAKKGADQRQQQMSESFKKMQDESLQLWQKINQEAIQKYEFLRPVEGAVERNEKLSKAQKLVDKAFSETPNDPKLSADQRAEVLRRHATVRNRAIAFSVLRHENSDLRARVLELEETLKGYQNSEPTAGEGTSKTGSTEQGMTLDSVAAGLLKYAT